MKKLGDILSNETLSKHNSSNNEKFANALVYDVCDDSRKVSEGSLFVAIGGNSTDGKKYIEDAISKGAKYIVLETDNHQYTEKYNDVLFIPVDNARHELAHISSRFFESNLEDVIAVTGTNGKSSTVDIIRQIWARNNRKAISVGTLGIVDKDGIRKKLSGTLTSPNPIELHKILHSFSNYSYDLNSSYDKNNSEKLSVAIEASSHGIDQHRLDCLPFSVCAFTNFTQDHLDYHKTMDNYWHAKERLFSELASSNTKFVVNADDTKSEKIAEIARARSIRCIEYGYEAKDIKIIDVIAKQSHQKIHASFFGKDISFALPLFGKFQVFNSLCAAASCYLSGIQLEKIIDALEHLNPINGRLEQVALINNEKRIYVDYAHTPDALKNAILSLREHNPKRIITVFGCGGERDHQKRPIMGKVAQKFSDIVIVTDDNPRGENPEEIRKMIIEGCPNGIEVDKRQNAIEYAIDILQDGDSLLIAGKGHEDYQQIGKEFFHFSDKEVILNKVSKGSK